MPETHRMAIIRVARDEEKIESLAERVGIFCERLQEMLESIDKNACELSFRVV